MCPKCYEKGLRDGQRNLVRPEVEGITSGDDQGESRSDEMQEEVRGEEEDRGGGGV